MPPPSIRMYDNLRKIPVRAGPPRVTRAANEVLVFGGARRAGSVTHRTVVHRDETLALALAAQLPARVTSGQRSAVRGLADRASDSRQC